MRTYLPVIASFCGLCLMLILGKVARMKVQLFQKLYLPSSVVGGLLGLVINQVVKSFGGDASEYLHEQWTLGWDHMAGFLINVVFSSLFLGVSIPSARTVWIKSGPQLMYGMVVAWGQWIVALLVTALLLMPAFGVNPMFATILPVGFAGGHGTAAGLTPTYTKLGWDQGGDFGLASATMGLVLSIVLGVAWVNIAARRGWVVKDKMDKATDAKLSIRGVYPVDKRPTAGIQTVKADSIDTLALHIAIVGIAMLIGYGIKVLFISIEETSESLKSAAFLSGFPMFPLCMAGGIVIQLGLERFDRRTKLVNAAVMERISGSALDYLITAAVASVDLAALSGGVIPFLILIGFGIVWHCVALMFLARHLLPNHWFERAIPELGMNMGVIASGLVLLRMVDPESKTPVPADFAFKQLLHSPFMGGGIWTALAVPLVHSIGIWATLVVACVVMTGWLSAWAFYFRRTAPYLAKKCTCKLCTSVRQDDLSHAMTVSGRRASDAGGIHIDVEMHHRRHNSGAGAGGAVGLTHDASDAGSAGRRASSAGGLDEIRLEEGEGGVDEHVIGGREDDRSDLLLGDLTPTTEVPDLLLQDDMADTPRVVPVEAPGAGGSPGGGMDGGGDEKEGDRSAASPSPTGEHHRPQRFKMGGSRAAEGYGQLSDGDE